MKRDRKGIVPDVVIVPIVWKERREECESIFQACKEEPELRERFGAEYEEYSLNVPGGLFPRCSPWDPSLLQV